MKTSWFIRGLVAAFTFALTQLVYAHAHPKHQNPAANESVTGSPKEVSIEFDNVIEPAFSSIIVTDATGKQANTEKSSIDPNNHRLMKVTLPTLSAGVYKVTWQAVANDGHHIQGHYLFTVK